METPKEKEMNKTDNQTALSQAVRTKMHEDLTGFIRPVSSEDRVANETTREIQQSKTLLAP